MKIVFIITDFGSFNNFLSELSYKYCSEEGAELHVICSNVKVINLTDKYDFTNLNIFFHFIPMARSIDVFGTLKTAKKINQIISQINPTLVHAHFTTGIFPTILFKISTVKYWGTFHGLGMSSSNGLTKFVFLMLESFCLLKLDKVFLVNSDDFNLLKRNGFRRKIFKYECFGFGCDLGKFLPQKYSPEFKSNLKRTLGIASDEKVIGFIGRFVHFKGFDIVVRVFNELISQKEMKFKLLLIGGKDSAHSTGLTDEEESNLSINPYVIDVGYQDNVAEYLSIIDIFLFPSTKEGLPTCVMEALSMGVPVIASDSRGSKDLIIHGINGFLVGENLETKQKVNQIIEFIYTLVEDKELYMKMSAEAFKGRDAYSRELFIEEHINYYKQLTDV